ncbi:aromatic amino acid transaminase [Agromyces sp. ISL-38]|uniref:aromatic amino acid transaminase n=1 Tax=Agromyces sp. ISL-38 TaxID=2819107 RepID=UPI001BEB552A|nr:aromatic amino acid transaminase [Agromyces sp. ISL-38]MBT2498020.1 aromatic amino acid transaminase [Agromyces sp. ISL-38]MBT2516905.1 aromatic amino acid transaminase [Streptomyces sp. ISL-90]
MMLTTMPQMRVDPIWDLASTFQSDPREDKLDLLLGVYRDDSKRAPVMRSVLAAEAKLLELAESKQYRGLSGNLVFNARISELVLGPELVARATTVQTVAGTGALRILTELLAITGPSRRFILGTPSYVNHAPIIKAVGPALTSYDLLDPEGRFDEQAMLDAVAQARPGDVLLLQGCCHNPTGLSMSSRFWAELTEAMLTSHVVPFVDQAYFGLGDGLQEDLEGMRGMLARVPEAVIAVSGSKAWSLYNERAGAAIVITSEDKRGFARSTLETIARSSYSQAPEHGAAIIAEILSDPALERMWRAELDAMRRRLATLRTDLIDGILAVHDSPTFRAVAEQRGMFLTLPLTVAEMQTLSTEFGVYGLPSGRINLAGVPRGQVSTIAEQIGQLLTRRRD